MFLTVVTETMVNSSLKETSQKYSCGSFSNLGEAAVCSSPSPSAGVSDSRCRLSLRSSSRDDLRLPGLAGHLGATLSDDQRPRRGLAVQAEAADEVLQDRAFGFPLLWRNGRGGKPVRCGTALWFPFTAHKHHVWTDGSRRWVMPLDHRQDRLSG